MFEISTLNKSQKDKLFCVWFQQTKHDQTLISVVGSKTVLAVALALS